MINNLIIIWLLLPYFTYCTERLSSPLWRHGDFKNPEIALGTRLNWIWKNCRCSLAFSKIQTFNLSYEYGKTWKYTHPKTNISEYKWFCQKILEIVGSEIIWRVSFNSSLHLWSLNCTNQVLYHNIFWTWAMFYLRFLVFSFVVFRVHKNRKFNYHLLFLAIFPDLEKLQFWSVNYICQICKL